MPENIPPPVCPKCRKPMRFLLRKDGGREFQCLDCDGGDPLQSPAIAKLLAGELRPPKQERSIVVTERRGKPNSQSWTDEANERLKGFVASGISLLRAAAALKRSMTSVRIQARKLGTPFPPIREIRKKITAAKGNIRRQD